MFHSYLDNLNITETTGEEFTSVFVTPEDTVRFGGEVYRSMAGLIRYAGLFSGQYDYTALLRWQVKADEGRKCKCLEYGDMSMVLENDGPIHAICFPVYDFSFLRLATTFRYEGFMYQWDMLWEPLATNSDLTCSFNIAEMGAKQWVLADHYRFSMPENINLGNPSFRRNITLMNDYPFPPINYADVLSQMTSGYSTIRPKLELSLEQAFRVREADPYGLLAQLQKGRG